MGHKTLIGGTAYNISGGKSLVSGTSYSISSGKTLIGGTAYNINLKKNVPTAMLYNDGNFVFQHGSKIASGKTLTASYTGFEEVNYNAETSIPWTSYKNNIKTVSFNNEISPIGITRWFNYACNLTSFNKTNLNIDSIIYMNTAFQNCQKVKMTPFCGANVVSMDYAFWNCRNMTGSPVCGNNVVNMSRAYFNCVNITGICACGNNVTNMAYAYYRCGKVNGGTVGNNVIDMAYVFYNCSNFSQVPIVGSNVVNMAYAYYNCFHSKTGNIYIYSPNVTNMINCIYRASPHRINIYVPAGSTTNKTIHNANKFDASLDGWSITWTKNSTCSYSTIRNIYIYPVADVDAARKKNGQ